MPIVEYTKRWVPGCHGMIELPAGKLHMPYGTESGEARPKLKGYPKFGVIVHVMCEEADIEVLTLGRRE